MQICFIVLFAVFATYDKFSKPVPFKEEDSEFDSTTPSTSPNNTDSIPSEYLMIELLDVRNIALFMDVHVMIFIGFGYLMTFMRRYIFGGVAFNFLLAAFVLQWDIIVDGLLHLGKNKTFPIGLDSLIQGDIAAAVAVISMGALLGRTTFLQLLVMGLIEMVLYCANLYLSETVWKVTDAGGSIFVHTFGAYFGLAASWVLHFSTPPSDDEESFLSSYTSDAFAMIGTLFLWIFWPSFNAADTMEDGQSRAIINTYLSLASCCVVSFLLSYLVSGERKFNMVHVQNSTIAGGVSVGAVADLMVRPWGALLIGTGAAVLSVIGFTYLTPAMARCGISDTCGVHNLHGMPGVLGGLLGVVLALFASTDLYGSNFNVFYPPGRKAWQQALYQLYALLATLVIAIIGGILAGFLISVPQLSEKREEGEESKKHLDDNYWTIHEAV